MKPIVFITILLSLYSCKDKRVAHYERLVDAADRIVIRNQETIDSLVIAASPELNNVKAILKRNIRPQSPVKFFPKRSIVLYSQTQQIGMLLISLGETPSVNFRSDSLNITFPLTYGIGRMLEYAAPQERPL